MNDKLLSPILKERSKRLDALHARLKASERESSDLRNQIEMIKALPTKVEVGTRLRIRDLLEPLSPAVEKLREARAVVEITQFEPSAGSANGIVHFSHKGMEVPEALDLAWFEEAE